MLHNNDIPRMIDSALNIINKEMIYNYSGGFSSLGDAVLLLKDILLIYKLQTTSIKDINMAEERYNLIKQITEGYFTETKNKNETKDFIIKYFKDVVGLNIICEGDDSELNITVPTQSISIEKRP